MAKSSVHQKRPLIAIAAFVAVLAISLVVLSLVMLRPAQGGGTGDTIGLGVAQSTRTAEAAEPAEKFALPDASSSSQINDKNASSASSLSQASHRSIVVKDPDPVVAYAAVDMSNAQTVSFAEQHGCLNPFPTAPRIVPDVTGWQSGAASAYDLEDNEGWDATASGVTLTRNSVTVAVPMSQSSLMGRTVQIVYGNQVVMATVTDVGGFAPMGRALDLAPGVWKAFGASTGDEWGVRTVHYRYL